jgi:PRC-barrel domain
MRSFRHIVAALALAAATPLAVTSVQAQQSETQAAEPTTTAIGLPIYTSDGEHLGEVVQIISYGDKPALRAEIGSFLGLGATTAVIPANMFERKPDRIELTMTAAEVRDTVAKQK